MRYESIKAEEAKKAGLDVDFINGGFAEMRFEKDGVKYAVKRASYSEFSLLREKIEEKTVYQISLDGVSLKEFDEESDAKDWAVEHNFSLDAVTKKKVRI